MNRTLYLHIGCEKTGTTALQAVLFNNQTWLQEQGYHFAQTGGSHNNRSIPDVCIDPAAPSVHLSDLGVEGVEQRRAFSQRIKSEFAQEISALPDRIHSVVVSSEHFQSITGTQQDVSSVRDFFSPYFSRVCIVCYLREQAESMRSRYSSVIRNGWASPDTFASMLDACRPDNPLYNYQRLLNIWETVFGRESLKVRIYDPSQFVGGELVDDFFAALELDVSGDIERAVEASNPPLSELGQIIGIALGMTLRRYGNDGRRNPLWTKAFEVLRAEFAGTGRQLSDQEFALIHERFADVNSAVNQNWFGRDGNLFPERSSALVVPDTLEESLALPLASIMAEVRRDGAGFTEEDGQFLARLSHQLEAEDADTAEQLLRLALAITPEQPLLKLKLLEYTQRRTQTPDDTA